MLFLLWRCLLIVGHLLSSYTYIIFHVTDFYPYASTNFWDSCIRKLSLLCQHLLWFYKVTWVILIKSMCIIYRGWRILIDSLITPITRGNQFRVNVKVDAHSKNILYYWILNKETEYMVMISEDASYQKGKIHCPSVRGSGSTAGEQIWPFFEKVSVHRQSSLFLYIYEKKTKCMIMIH